LQPAFARALETAANNIREYARRNCPAKWFTDFADGRRLGQIVRPLDAMARMFRRPLSLPSTLLMTVIRRRSPALPPPASRAESKLEIMGIAQWLA